ncbi:MAG: diacylglycerol kinase [Methylococcales bacterium]|nr:diacylglycerol kinase [Methylococcales bacterium]MDD5753613.1 diacylglycerol kinase [Methylococcales bacterium]
MANQHAKGIARLRNATQFSISGFKATWQHEEAFQQEVLLLIVAHPAAFFLAKNPVEILLLIGSIVLILLVELLNSAIETVVDRIGLEQHELSGRAKDISSAAVMLSLIWAAITWSVILIF